MQLIVVLAGVLVLGLANAACPAYDRPECSTRGGYLDTDSCNTPYVLEWCPYLCGECQESERPTCDADPDCHQSDHGCIWLSTRGDAEWCSAQTDSHVCENNGGEWGCNSCYNLSLKKYCPHMCGYC